MGDVIGAVTWVDPRTDPQPPAEKPPVRATEDPAAIAELIEHCQAGRIYAVERWLASGRPIQVAYGEVDAWRAPATPLSVAMESGQHDLTLLLLCNGYRPELEPQPPLNFALRKRAWDYVDLLLAWGTDPKAADPDAVLETYQVSTMERFWDLGLDLTRDRHLAYYLAESTSNKPAYGWAKRHNADPRVARALTLALGEAVSENREKGVALLVWAGADPHLQVPSLKYTEDDDDPDDDRSSAIEVAVMLGRGKLLKYLKPDPDRDDWEALWGEVCDPDTTDFLYDRRPPRDWSKAIERNIWRMGWWYWDRSDHRACLERLFEHFWGRLSTLSPRDCQEMRGSLLKMESSSDLAWLLGKLSKPQHCAGTIFAELVRTPAIRQKMAHLGLDALLPSRPTDIRTGRRRVRAGGKPDRPAQASEDEWLDNLSAEQRASFLRQHISREQLYAEVWADPVTRVAERYGISDVAVAKWCRKLDVPRPGRGYWACKAAGQKLRQSPLPPRARGVPMYVGRPKPSREKRPAPAGIRGLERFPRAIPVPDVGDPEHVLVARTRRALEEAATGEGGIIGARAGGGLDVEVSKGSVARALRMVNAIVCALEGAGFGVEVAACPAGAERSAGGRTYAVLDGERVPFALVELTERVERPPNDQERAAMRRNPWKTKGPFYSHRPTGALSLQIEGGSAGDGHRRSWSDSTQRRLEALLHSFIRGLLVSAEAQRRRGARA
ncbi:MAG: hypothetical protein B7Z61_06225 [Acidobacteria bacterium 37-71-11]|nr:MAG: hypothetical protein B7Z61_06225 [Acidobacteria bacterium 37-71-11]HQT93352.1 hypothetical protein [Thermoanaerobaculaceae bacterium]